MRIFFIFFAVTAFFSNSSLFAADDDAYRTGLQYERDGNYKAALSEYKKALKNRESPDPKIFLHTANSLYQLKRFEEALEFYEKYVAVNPSNLKVKNFTLKLKKFAGKESRWKGLRVGTNFGYGMVDGAYDDPFSTGLVSGGDLFDFSTFGTEIGVSVGYGITEFLSADILLDFWPTIDDRSSTTKGKAFAFSLEEANRESWSGWGLGLSPSWWMYTGSKWRMGVQVGLGLVFVSGDLQYSKLVVSSGTTITDVNGGVKVSGQSLYFRPAIQIERKIGSRYGLLFGLNYLAMTVSEFKVQTATGDFSGMAFPDPFQTSRGPLKTSFSAFRFTVGFSWYPRSGK